MESDDCSAVDNRESIWPWTDDPGSCFPYLDYPMAWCEVVQNLLAPRMIDSMLCRLEIIASLSYDFHNAFISYSSEVGKALFRTAIREI